MSSFPILEYLQTFVPWLACLFRVISLRLIAIMILLLNIEVLHMSLTVDESESFDLGKAWVSAGSDWVTFKNSQTNHGIVIIR